MSIKLYTSYSVGYTFAVPPLYDTLAYIIVKPPKSTIIYLLITQYPIEH